MKLILVIVCFLALWLQLYSFTQGWKTWIPDAIAVGTPIVSLFIILRSEVLKNKYRYQVKAKKT